MGYVALDLTILPIGDRVVVEQGVCVIFCQPKMETKTCIIPITTATGPITNHFSPEAARGGMQNHCFGALKYLISKLSGVVRDDFV